MRKKNSIQKRRFILSANYRRRCLASSLGFEKARNNHPTMVEGGYIAKLKEFPSEDSVGQLKQVVDGFELKLRGGDVVSDSLNNGLRLWDAGKTSAQTANVLAETALGTHALGEAIVEWRKGHYFCCVCSGVACSCFYVGAAASLIPGGYGVWKAASKVGAISKGVTGVCRKVTGGHGL